MLQALRLTAAFCSFGLSAHVGYLLLMAGYGASGAVAGGVLCAGILCGLLLWPREDA